MPPRNRRTLLVRTSGFPSGTSSDAIFKLMVEKFGADELDAVQFCPGGLVRVTFLREGTKAEFEEAGSVLLGDVRCEITRTISTFALVFGFPAEGSLDSVISVLQKFGEVKSIDHQQWVGHSIKTGTLRVRIIRRSTHIPRFLSIDGIRCKVWYREQPLRCDICSGPHKVASCPMRGKCMKCHKEGHIRRDCPVIWRTTPASSPVDSSDPVDPTPAEASTHDLEDSSSSGGSSDDESQGSVELGSESDLRDNELSSITDVSTVFSPSDLGQGEKGVHPRVGAESCPLPLSSSEDDITEVSNSALEGDAEEVCPPAASDAVPAPVVADAPTENETCDGTNAVDEVTPLDPSQSMFETETTDVVSGQRKRPLADSSGEEEVGSCMADKVSGPSSKRILTSPAPLEDS